MAQQQAMSEARQAELFRKIMVLGFADAGASNARPYDPAPETYEARAKALRQAFDDAITQAMELVGEDALFIALDAQIGAEAKRFGFENLEY